MHRFHFWGFFFGLLYVSALLAGITLLADAHALATWVPLGDFVLMAFATHQLARLCMRDSVSARARAWTQNAEPYSLRSTLGMMAQSRRTATLWAALVIVLAYFATSYAWFVILILALASIGSLLVRLEQRLGGAQAQTPEHDRE
ncbi:MAG TPA: hypothetical protein VF829_01510 [Candidatus Paceibacterota bacterium]